VNFDPGMSPAARQLQMRNIVIEHDRFLEAVGALRTFHMPVDEGVPSVATLSALIGDSRTGKTFATKRYARQFPAISGETGIIQRVVYVDMPMEGGGGQRAILESFAQALHFPVTSRMNSPTQIAGVLRALEAQKVELLILDETEQVFRENDRRLLGFGRGLLRKILDLGTLSIVCIGLHPTYNLLAADPQLTGRGGLPYKQLRPYSWENHDERGVFRLLCDAFDRQLPFPERSGLGASDLAHAIYWVTQGNIGRLKTLIEAAGARAINDANAQRIERRHFEEAYELSKPPGRPFNPFRDGMTNAPKAADGGRPGRVKSGDARTVFSKKPALDLSHV